MNRLTVKYIVAAAFCALGLGCGLAKPKVTDPLPADQLAQVLQQSFQSAQGSVRTSVLSIIKEIQDKDVAAAFKDVKELTAEPSITKDQRIAAIRAGHTIGQLLQDAAQNGDEKAAETMHSYNASH